MKMAKKVVLLLLALLVLPGLVFATQSAFRAAAAARDYGLIIKIAERHAESRENRPEQYYQTFTTVACVDWKNPFARPLIRDIDAFNEWAGTMNAYLYELRQDNRPFHITVNCKWEKGKNTFVYEGYVTNEAGEQVPYRNEKTFSREFLSAQRVQQMFPALGV